MASKATKAKKAPAAADDHARKTANAARKAAAANAAAIRAIVAFIEAAGPYPAGAMDELAAVRAAVADLD